MGNTNVKTSLERLQKRIEEFYEEGKRSMNKDAAADLWINEHNVVVKKDKPVLPGDHLTRAQYKDVIERKGTTEQQIRYDITSCICFGFMFVERFKFNCIGTYHKDFRPSFKLTDYWKKNFFQIVRCERRWNAKVWSDAKSRILTRHSATVYMRSIIGLYSKRKMLPNCKIFELLYSDQFPICPISKSEL